MSKPILTLDASPRKASRKATRKATRKAMARKAMASRGQPVCRVNGWLATPHYTAWHWEGDTLWCTRGEYCRQVGFSYRAEARSATAEVVHEVFHVRGAYLIVEHTRNGRRVIGKSEFARKAYAAAAYRQAAVARDGSPVEVWRASALDLPAHIQHQ